MNNTGVYDLLMSLETKDAVQKEQKATEKRRRHQIMLLQQQITSLKEHRDQLKNDVSQLSSDTETWPNSVDTLVRKVDQMNSLQSLLGVAVTSVNQISVCLEFCTSYPGTSHECYTVELTLPGATPVSVLRHDLPHFIPVQQIVAECLTVADTTAYQQFVWTVYRYLHAFVARRQETVLAKDAVGEDVKCDMQASLAYDVIEVRLSSSQDRSRMVTTQLTYSELDRCLPSQVTLCSGGAQAVHDENVIESIKKHLMSTRLSVSLLHVAKLLNVNN